MTNAFLIVIYDKILANFFITKEAILIDDLAPSWSPSEFSYTWGNSPNFFIVAFFMPITIRKVWKSLNLLARQRIWRKLVWYWGLKKVVFICTSTRILKCGHLKVQFSAQSNPQLHRYCSEMRLYSIAQLSALGALSFNSFPRTLHTKFLNTNLNMSLWQGRAR